MGLKFKYKKAKAVSYGGTRSLNSIKYIIIHYTGNNGDTALNNAAYFAQSNTRAAGAHCFIDGSGIVYKSVPLKRIAWAVGGFYTQSKGAGSKYKIVTNTNSLSIEMCNCENKVPKKVFNDVVSLTKYYMKKYNIPASNVYRHWDVNGKGCPSPWAGKDNVEWKAFKKAIGGQDVKYTVVKKNSSENAIRWMQGKLNSLASGADIVVDGDWGPATQKKLERYWKQLKWKKGSYAGKKTCTALYKNRKK